MDRIKKRTKIITVLLAFFMAIMMMPLLGRTAYADEYDSKITLEFGNKHEAIASDYAAYINSSDNSYPCLLNASVSGSTVTLYYDATKDTAYPEHLVIANGVEGKLGKAQYLLNYILFKKVLEDDYYIDNGEMIVSINLAQKTIDNYKTEDEILNERWDSEETPLPEEQTLYVLWHSKKLDKLVFSIEQPVCGKSGKSDGDSDDNKPEVTVPDGANYEVSSDRYWMVIPENPAEDGWDDFEGTFEGEKKYHALLWFSAKLGYYFAEGTTVEVEGENAKLVGTDETPFSHANPYLKYGDACAYVEIPAVHTWGEWTQTKAPTREEKGEEERVCSADTTHKETRSIDKLNIGISVDPKSVEWTAEEGYKGATEEGVEEDAVHQNVTATSTGEIEVEFILAGLKDVADNERFSVSAGGMSVTVAPKEGLAPGTYKAVLVIGDWEDRFKDVEVPITFTVTEKTVDPVTKYTITYKLNGGKLDGKTGTVTVEAEEGEKITLPKPTRSGYTFDHWKGSKYKAGDKYTVKGDHTFTAQWKKNSTDDESETKETKSSSGSNSSKTTATKTTTQTGTSTSGNTTTSTTSASPNTGDSSNVVLWVVTLSVSLLGLILTLVLRRRYRR